MGKMLIIFWCALALFVVMGAASHIIKNGAQDSPAIIILPTKCQEQTAMQKNNGGCLDKKNKKDARTGELFLRKIKRSSRKYYA